MKIHPMIHFELAKGYPPFGKRYIETLRKRSHVSVQADIAVEISSKFMYTCFFLTWKTHPRVHRVLAKGYPGCQLLTGSARDVIRDECSSR